MERPKRVGTQEVADPGPRVYRPIAHPNTFKLLAQFEIAVFYY